MYVSLNKGLLKFSGCKLMTFLMQIPPFPFFPSSLPLFPCIFMFNRPPPTIVFWRTYTHESRPKSINWKLIHGEMKGGIKITNRLSSSSSVTKSAPEDREVTSSEAVSSSAGLTRIEHVSIMSSYYVIMYQCHFATPRHCYRWKNCLGCQRGPT